eukprot:TRINITY_DN9923_c1_g1_i5.p4 TRINITY_DN9923_c1_g1~~TRINITY_DN9923_c1_g1_i5.p4  ORF type:complete len:157 (-),score=20.69 TRINITY_DN9923_c1_g1_i5:257-727(-)
MYFFRQVSPSLFHQYYYQQHHQFQYSSQAQQQQQISEIEYQQLQAGDIQISDSALNKLKELQQEQPGENLVLRISIEGGGCSGFQYVFSLDTAVKEDDKLFEREGAKIACDNVSFEFLKGSTVEYQDDLIRSAFQIAENPNAEQSCGCKASFSAKM